MRASSSAWGFSGHEKTRGRAGAPGQQDRNQKAQVGQGRLRAQLSESHFAIYSTCTALGRIIGPVNYFLVLPVNYACEIRVNVLNGEMRWRELRPAPETARVFCCAR